MRQLQISLCSSIVEPQPPMNIEGYQPTPAGMAEALRILLNGDGRFQARIVELPLDEMSALDLLAHLGGMAASRRWRHAMLDGETYTGAARVEVIR